MRGREYLLITNQILQLQPEEAAYRTVISRAYYAAFLEMRSYGESYLGLERSGSAREHGQVGRLVAESLPDVASKLAFLRRFRNLADYDLSIGEATLADQAISSITTCQAILAELDVEVARRLADDGTRE